MRVPPADGSSGCALGSIAAARDFLADSPQTIEPARRANPTSPTDLTGSIHSSTFPTNLIDFIN